MTDLWPRAAKRGSQGPGRGWAFPLATAPVRPRTAPSALPRCLPAGASGISPGGAALRRQGVRPSGGQALAGPSPPRPRGSPQRLTWPRRRRGSGWSPRPRAAGRCAGLRGASAAAGWRLCGRARAARSVPGGGARRHRGRGRIPQVLPLLLASLLPVPSWPQRPSGLSSCVAYGP